MKRASDVVDLPATKTRFDSWTNALTGIGTALRDKLESTIFSRGSRFADDELETLFHEEDMAARIVEALPEDGMRRGYGITVEGEEDSEVPSEAKEYEKRLKFRQALREAAIWARCYGGAVVYLGIDDGQPEDQPVNIDGIRSIKFATVLTKRELAPHSYYVDPEDDAKFGQPEIYRIEALPVALGTQGTTAAAVQSGVQIHETRLLRLDGALTSPRRQQANKGWSESVLVKVHAVLVQFNIGWQGTAHLLQDASQGVFKMQGLIEMIASGDKETLNARMEVVEMGRSVARSIMLDADTESFERQNFNFSGLPKVLEAFMERLSAAARMPVSKLMGQAPKGLNATGEGDTRAWYDQVEGYQQDTLLAPVEDFHKLMFAAQDFKPSAPEKWEVKFHKLWQMNDKEQAELEKSTAEKDKIYMDSQVLLPEEVALNRFGVGGYNPETQIDMDARKEMLDAELALAKEKAGEDPMENLNGLNSGATPGETGANQVGEGETPETPEDNET